MAANPPQLPGTGPWHPRTLPTRLAGAELQDFLWKIQEEKQLTSAELLLILIEAETELIAALLRVQRHPKQPAKHYDEP